MKRQSSDKVIRVGALSVKLKTYEDGRIGFDYKPTGRARVKVRKTTEKKAEEEARKLLTTASGGRIDRLAIDEFEYAEFLRWKANRKSGALVKDLAGSFIETKRRKGISTESVRKWDHDLKAFSKTFGERPLEEVKRPEVARWLEARNVGARRFNNILATLISLNRFARKEGALPAELCGAELIDRRRVTFGVSTYTPAELAAILAVVPPPWLPAIVLGAFCGLRPQEVCPEPRSGKKGIMWGNVLWDKRKVDVPAAVSKTRKRRFAPLTDAAMAFLEAFRGIDPALPVSPRERFCKYTSVWARAAGMEWKPDALRHSFASYRLALTKDTAALALEMGNSPAIIFNHYLDLKHEEEAAEYFGMRPDLAHFGTLSTSSVGESGARGEN